MTGGSLLRSDWRLAFTALMLFASPVHAQFAGAAPDRFGALIPAQWPGQPPAPPMLGRPPGPPPSGGAPLPNFDIHARCQGSAEPSGCETIERASREELRQGWARLSRDSQRVCQAQGNAAGQSAYTVAAACASRMLQDLGQPH